MKKLIIPIILMMFTLCGCYEETEPNNIAYITAVGIDVVGEDMYNFTIQFAKTAEISGGASESGGKGGQIIENIVIEAPNLYTAINWGNHIISKNLSMSHIKLFVFSDEVARKGVKDLTETILRDQEIRPNIYFAIAKENSQEYLTNIKPVVEINPAKYYQLLFEQNNYGGIPRNESYSFVLYDESMCKQNVLPVVGIVKSNEIEKNGEQSSGGGISVGGMNKNESDGGNEEESEEDSEEKSIINMNQESAPIVESDFEYRSRNYMAGELGVEIKNKSEAIGMAIFKNDKLVGYMGGIESLIYNILTGNYKKGYLTFRVDDIEKPVTIRAEMKEKPKIIYDKDTNSVLIEPNLEGDFMSIISEEYTNDIINKFEKQASEDLNEAAENFLKTTRDKFDSDVIGVGCKAKGFFLTNEEYNKFNWPEKYKTLQFRVKSKINIRRTGLISRG